MEPAEYALMDQVEAGMWWYRALHARLAQALDDVQGGVVLDAGCGTGGFLAVLAEHRKDLARVGLEWNQAAARRAHAKSGALIARGTVAALPFGDAQFAAAISADVLCHAAVEPIRALGELRRVLRPGGRLILNLPAYQWLMSSHDARVHNTRRFTARGIAAMLRQTGFARVRAQYWNGLLLPLMILHRKRPRRGGDHQGDAASDVAPIAPWLDAIFHAMTTFEQRLPLRLPAGGSVLAIAEKA